MRRYGMVLGIKPGKVKEYKKRHTAVWPSILKMIWKCHIRNYSIYLHKFNSREYYLFSYFEYIGRNFKTDMKKMAADPETQRWWSCCMPCLKPLKNREKGELWANMKEVFHCK